MEVVFFHDEYGPHDARATWCPGHMMPHKWFLFNQPTTTKCELRSSYRLTETLLPFEPKGKLVTPPFHIVSFTRSCARKTHFLYVTRYQPQPQPLQLININPPTTHETFFSVRPLSPLHRWMKLSKLVKSKRSTSWQLITGSASCAAARVHHV